jgi:hypothetical protein
MPGPVRTVPTAEEVAAMTNSQRGAARQRLRRNGIALPPYLVPLTSYEITARARAAQRARRGDSPLAAAEEDVSQRERAELREANALHQAKQQQREEQLRRRGYPKEAPCLKCGKPRLAKRPDDRLHNNCVTDAIVLYQVDAA